MSDNHYMLAALDMDGTLLNSDHVTTPYTRDVIQRAADAGKWIALSTGRTRSELTGHLSVLPGVAFIIGESGGWICDLRQQRTLRRLFLAAEDVTCIFEALRGMEVVIQAFVDEISYVTASDAAGFRRCHLQDFTGVFDTGSRYHPNVEGLCLSSPGRVGKINLYLAKPADKARLANVLSGLSVAVTDSIGVGFEISPTQATKALGLQCLCDAIGLPIGQTIAVGDGGNDVDIMTAAGFSVAMGNAIDEVKALAKAITDDNDHDGCARALEKYLLNDQP